MSITVYAKFADPLAMTAKKLVGLVKISEFSKLAKNNLFFRTSHLPSLDYKHILCIVRCKI
mgnify:CR=1 FL=1